MSRISPEDCENIFFSGLQHDIKNFAHDGDVANAQRVWTESHGNPTAIANIVREEITNGSGVGKVITLLEYATLKDPKTNQRGIDPADAGELIKQTLNARANDLIEDSNRNRGLLNIFRRGPYQWLRDQAQGGEDETLATRYRKSADNWEERTEVLRRCQDVMPQAPPATI